MQERTRPLPEMRMWDRHFPGVGERHKVLLTKPTPPHPRGLLNKQLKGKNSSLTLKPNTTPFLLEEIPCRQGSGNASLVHDLGQAHIRALHTSLSLTEILTDSVARTIFSPLHLHNAHHGGLAELTGASRVLLINCNE